MLCVARLLAVRRREAESGIVGSGWECYFHAVSGCSEAEVWEPYSVPVRADFRWDHRGYLYRVDTRHQRVLHYANVDGPWQVWLGRWRSACLVGKAVREVNGEVGGR